MEWKNEKRLLEKKRREQKKFLRQLETEVATLEKEIQDITKANRKRRNIRNLKIVGRTLQMLYPYIITTGITVAASHAIGLGYPIVMDDFTNYAKVMREYDNEGHEREVTQYSSFEDEKNVVHYQSQWEEQEDGTYERKVREYDLGDLSFWAAYELMNTNDLLDSLGKPTIEQIEKTNKLDDAELERLEKIEEQKEQYIFLKEKKIPEEHISIVAYETDKSQFRVEKESVSKNIWVSVVNLWGAMMLGYSVFRTRERAFDYNYSDKIGDLYETYKPLKDTKKLEKKLGAKKQTYQALTRG